MLRPGSLVFPGSYRGTVSHTEEGLHKHRREELFFADFSSFFFILLLWSMMRILEYMIGRD
jgi:hypothetical protein